MINFNQYFELLFEVDNLGLQLKYVKSIDLREFSKDAEVPWSHDLGKAWVAFYGLVIVCFHCECFELEINSDRCAKAWLSMLSFAQEKKFHKILFWMDAFACCGCILPCN